MPELLETFDDLCAAVGGGDVEARFLSHWCPPPVATACSLATWTRDAHLLVRSYDYPPLLCDTTVLASSWTGTQVLAMVDCLWGAVDGINAHGLAVALAFGGREAVGPGFGIGLVVRYVLEVARDVADAVGRRGLIRLARAGTSLEACPPSSSPARPPASATASRSACTTSAGTCSAPCSTAPTRTACRGRRSCAT
jgi:predicted choloylglycine hydrolase